jgi:DNA-binding LacI/PurR family transcriptional regulator
MGRLTRRVTLADVARAAGVAPSTASLAFSGSGQVSPGARERVLAAAAELGYAGPDPVARSLRSGRSGVVAVVVGERLGYAFRDPVMVQFLDGLSEELGHLDANMLLVAGEAALPAPAPGRTAGLPMDAAVISDCGVASGDLVTALQRRGVPVVGVDHRPADGVPVVGIDDVGATRELVGHLLNLGHRELGVVTLPLRLDGHRGVLDDASVAARGCEAGVAVQRLTGVRAALAGRPDVRVTVVETAGNVVEEGELAASALLGGPGPRPTALVAQSDVLALGCLRAASARGLAVPRELSVAGFDGVDLHLFDGTELTTVVQPAREKGVEAGRVVTALLAGGAPADVTLPVRVRPGTTTAPPP